MLDFTCVCTFGPKFCPRPLGGSCSLICPPQCATRMAVSTQQGLRLLTTHGALLRVHLYPGVVRVTSLGDSCIILSDPSQPNGGNLKIGPNGQRADWKGGRGPWARFEVASTGRDGAVQLRSVGHFEAGRTIFLGVDGNGNFTPTLEPTAFIVTAASDDPAGGAPSHLGPPAPPVLELSNEMKAAFVRDGYLHLPGAVADSLVAAALQQINARLGEGPDAWERSEDGLKLGGAVGSSAAVADLLYRSAAFGIAEQLLGPAKRPKAGQVALRFPSPPGEAVRTKREEQWHIDGMNKHSHMSPFDLLLGVPNPNPNPNPSPNPITLTLTLALTL